MAYRNLFDVTQVYCDVTNSALEAQCDQTALSLAVTQRTLNVAG